MLKSNSKLSNQEGAFERSISKIKVKNKGIVIIFIFITI